MGTGIMRDLTLKRRDLDDSPTLGCVGTTYSGHVEGESWSDTEETKGPECMWSWGVWTWGGWGCVSCVHVITRNMIMGWVPVWTILCCQKVCLGFCVWRDNLCRFVGCSPEVIKEVFETTEGEVVDLYDKFMKMVGWKVTDKEKENRKENDLTWSFFDKSSLTRSLFCL